MMRILPDFGPARGNLAFRAVTGGIGCVAVAAVITVAFPAFTRYRAPSADRSPATRNVATPPAPETPPR